ncbi:MAG: serine protease [Bacilli bacterium]|nr:serine protease [Bacilli bacterium]
MRNKKYIIFVFLFFIVLVASACKTNNTIENKSYNVNIDINDINEAFIPASEKAKEAVVGVSLYAKASIIQSWHLSATGSGVIYKGTAYLKDGSSISVLETADSNNVDYYEYYLLTNAHVVNSNESNKDIKIYLSRIDTLVSGSLVGINQYEDLAVVKFTTTIFITPLEFSNIPLRSGEIVLAVGNPLGYEYASTVTMGIVSNESRYIEVSRDLNGDDRDDWDGVVEVIQHDASINSGNSGGALVNIKGELVGINAMKVTDKDETIEGIGFAIPLSIIKNVLDDMENGKPAKVNNLDKLVVYSVNDIINRDVLNLSRMPKINLDNFSYTYGAYIFENNDNEYGLQPYDIVIKMNDIDIYNEGMFSALLRNYNGSKISWEVYRNGSIQVVEYNFD